MIGLTAEEAGYLRSRDKIMAIKLVRSRTGLDLRGARDLVERWDGKTLLKEEDLGRACKRCLGTGIEPGGGTSC